MIKIIIGYFILAGIITFFMYGIDKYKAKHKKWRIPERVLIGACFFGGALGGALGMAAWHHKTKKIKFKILVPLAVVINCVLILMACRYLA